MTKYFSINFMVGNLLLCNKHCWVNRPRRVVLLQISNTLHIGTSGKNLFLTVKRIQKLIKLVFNRATHDQLIHISLYVILLTVN